MAYSSRAWLCLRCGASPPAQKLFSKQKKDQYSEVSGLPPPNVTRCDWVSLRAFSNPEEACSYRGSNGIGLDGPWTTTPLFSISLTPSIKRSRSPMNAFGEMGSLYLLPAVILIYCLRLPFTSTADCAFSYSIFRKETIFWLTLYDFMTAHKPSCHTESNVRFSKVNKTVIHCLVHFSELLRYKA